MKLLQPLLILFISFYLGGCTNIAANNPNPPPEKPKFRCGPISHIGIKLPGCEFRCTQLTGHYWVDTYRRPVFTTSEITIPQIVRGCVSKHHKADDILLMMGYRP